MRGKDQITTGPLNPPRRGRPPKPQPGHVPGTSAAQGPEKSGPTGSALATVAIVPTPTRLLDLEATAAYLSVSGWTVRDLLAAGILQRVRIPLRDHGELRRLLFDRQDLDRLIEAWKDNSNG